MKWKKALASNPNDNCVECGELEGAIVVRDSKDAHGPALDFPADAWRAFIAGVRSGDFPAGS
ncbi:DUF397 domain-containing protein [Kitasatospora sp. NPDC005751]|uniref:DUF397 domain-containing protein n=1 Tax=unclassified Kitasatospora TaxID=2633591 RepID=UPI0033D68CD5